jgi:hypothetical protein
VDECKPLPLTPSGAPVCLSSGTRRDVGMNPVACGSSFFHASVKGLNTSSLYTMSKK